jgi:hypothetical protein
MWIQLDVDPGWMWIQLDVHPGWMWIQLDVDPGWMWIQLDVDPVGCASRLDAWMSKHNSVFANAPKPVRKLWGVYLSLRSVADILNSAPVESQSYKSKTYTRAYLNKTAVSKPSFKKSAAPSPSFRPTLHPPPPPPRIPAPPPPPPPPSVPFF